MRYRIGSGSRAPCSVSGRRPPSPLATTCAPISSSGSSDAPHRPRAQRGVAVEDRRDRTAGHRAHHQPAAGAGIAEIERIRRLARSRRRRRPRTRQANSPVRSTLAPSARIDLAVLSTSSPSSRPEIRVSPTASAPRIRARCEIDLSPGTRTLPVRGPLARDSSGVGLVGMGQDCVLCAGRQVSHGSRRVTRPSECAQSAIDSGRVN